ncbi:hypothetical protein GCK72_007379 [Caenorhabditis remanei]|uniref:BTB domain-containing protein n=1 Tax=Caenorhabditis remanei TaxID=31234 RepID=A0A6A5HH74_CAERE|nr:hypothetical protein GCK72_007379 [Caenorhabditis remanei]KAF1767420.1 hypothetical protein GCK72_007379 [Caenorhabditis remanei]
MTAPAKKFVMRHDFTNISSLKEDGVQYSPTEEHFNVPWYIRVIKNNGHLGIHFSCNQPKTTTWSISTKAQIMLISVTGKSTSRTFEYKYANEDEFSGWGWNTFINWENMEMDYMIDDHITIECHVEIFGMSGIKKKKLKNFDATMEEFSDLVIIVENEKFYVSKLFLADQSSYFKSLLTRKQEEFEKPEITLDGCKSEDFQYFLELIYGESPIDGETIDKIVQLADKYQAPTAIRKCENFLINNSGKTLKVKLQMAKKYKLENLKMSCLSKINTVEDIRSVLSYTTSEMDPSVVGALLQKSLLLLS